MSFRVTGTLTCMQIIRVEEREREVNLPQPHYKPHVLMQIKMLISYALSIHPPSPPHPLRR